MHSRLASCPGPAQKLGGAWERLWANTLCTQYAVRRGELWSACDIVFCVHPGWEGLFMSSIFRITNNSSSNKIQNVEIHFEIRKSTWNPEIHFEIQKSTWNPEIQSEIRNPREIQWISKSRRPRRAVADPSGWPLQLRAIRCLLRL